LPFSIPLPAGNILHSKLFLADLVYMSFQIHWGIFLYDADDSLPVVRLPNHRTCTGGARVCAAVVKQYDCNIDNPDIVLELGYARDDRNPIQISRYYSFYYNFGTDGPALNLLNGFLVPFYFIRLVTIFISLSFSFGSEIAIKSANAASPLSFIFFSPVSR